MIDPLSFQNVCGQTAAGHLMLAKGLFESGKISAAVVEMDLAIKHSVDFGKAYFWKGVMLYLLARHDDAQTCLERSIELDPDEATGWFALALLQHERGHSNEASHSIRRSLALDPNNARAHNLHGTIAQAQGTLDEVIAADRQVLKLSPGLSQNRLRLALSLQRQGNEAAAIAEVVSCLRMQSTDVNTRICLVNLLLSLGEVSLAIRECHATALLFPAHPLPLLRLAQIHADRNDDAAAIAAATTAIQRTPKHLECEMLLAKIRLKQGDPTTALTHAKAALAIDAELFEAKELVKAAESALPTLEQSSS